MRVLEMVEAMRAELRKQERLNADVSVKVLASDKPDTVRVFGPIDLYELAKAIKNG